MRILALEHELPASAGPSPANLLQEEAAAVWDLMKRGIIRDIWFTAADRRAVLTLECADGAEARQHLATLPLVRQGQIGFTVHELRPYDGFERLFASKTSGR